MSYLEFEVHFATDLVSSDVIDALQAALVTISPKFCARLRVLEYERDRDAVSVDALEAGALHDAVVSKGVHRGALYDQLSAASPPPEHPRRFGSVFVRGSAPKTFLGIRFDEYAPARPSGEKWLFSNTVSGEIGAARVGGVPQVEWVSQLMIALGEHPELLWGAACDHDEFWKRNIHDDARGMWALGRDMSRSLPGLYWLNLFGPSYRRLIGDERLHNAPAVDTRLVGRSMAFTLYDGPQDWTTTDGVRRHHDVLEHVGRQFFFDREAPDAKTVAPDFGLPALSPKDPLRVVIRD